jgi:hypothetical protein
MRRDELLSAIERVRLALSESDLLPVAVKSLRKEERDAARPFEAMKRYVLHAEKFGVAERQLLSMLDLSALNEPRLWATISAGEDQERIHAVYSAVRLAWTTYLNLP